MLRIRDYNWDMIAFDVMCSIGVVAGIVIMVCLVCMNI